MPIIFLVALPRLSFDHYGATGHTLVSSYGVSGTCTCLIGGHSNRKIAQLCYTGLEGSIAIRDLNATIRFRCGQNPEGLSWHTTNLYCYPTQKRLVS